jgi:hypothetical protein
VIAKLDQVEDRDYLRWVRRRPCAFCARRAPSEAHHTIVKGMGGATLRDDYAAPVCGRCHRRCEGETVYGRGPISKAEQLRAAQEHRGTYLAELELEQLGGGLVPW